MEEKYRIVYKIIEDMTKRILICLYKVNKDNLGDRVERSCIYWNLKKIIQNMYEYKISYDKILFCIFDLCRFTHKCIKLDYIIN